MKIIPYVQYSGNCEEALKLYEKVLNGKVEIAGRYDNPAMNAPEEFKNKIMHARLEYEGNELFASDVMPGMMPEGNGQSVALCLTYLDSKQGKSVFDSLSEGGKVEMPFEKQFWGDWYGAFTDKYGIRWMVNAND